MDTGTNNLIGGLHHITVLADDARRNLEFYAGVLGLRLIKQTVNFDDPGVYHLYYGDRTGSPGTILTFFPYRGLPPGKTGTGQSVVVSFSLPLSSLAFWEQRFERLDIAYEKPSERFKREVLISLKDIDGLKLELVFNELDNREGFSGGHIPEEYAIRGFFGTELWVKDLAPTANLLTGLMEHRLIAEHNGRMRFAVEDLPGKYVDLMVPSVTGPGKSGNGSVHHIAFRTPGELAQNVLWEKLRGAGMYPTPVIDRQYFRSVYFREPGGVLFEIATDDPGFLIDEPAKTMGQKLMLPPQHESRRQELEEILPKLDVDLSPYY